jgi:hypothetical protein
MASMCSSITSGTRHASLDCTTWGWRDDSGVQRIMRMMQPLTCFRPITIRASVKALPFFWRCLNNDQTHFLRGDFFSNYTYTQFISDIHLLCDLHLTHTHNYTLTTRFGHSVCHHRQIRTASPFHPFTMVPTALHPWTSRP